MNFIYSFYIYQRHITYVAIIIWLIKRKIPKILFMVPNSTTIYTQPYCFHTALPAHMPLWYDWNSTVSHAFRCCGDDTPKSGISLPSTILSLPSGDQWKSGWSETLSVSQALLLWRYPGAKLWLFLRRLSYLLGILILPDATSQSP